MGQEVERREFTREDRTRYREKVRQCLDVFARMLRESRFDVDRPMTGIEVELNLVDDACDPAMKNAEVLEAIADPDFQTELGQFNLEINVAPRRLAGGGLSSFENERARQPQRGRGEGPPGRRAHGAWSASCRRCRPSTCSPRRCRPTRATGCSTTRSSPPAARTSRSPSTASSGSRSPPTRIMPEAACTSMQLHLQVSPEDFAAYWNASQAIAGIQLAIGANSPFLFGKELWAETRIALFEQATDTRSEELKAQGVRPRVWFGERWITSIFDLFEENVRYFPALLPITDDEDPDRGARRRRHARAGGAAAAQRHHLPLEPAGVRRRARRPAPAGGEPGAARRARPSST